MNGPDTGSDRTGTSREQPPTLRVPRPDESAAADEMTMSRGWLDHLRRSAMAKLEDLDPVQLRWKPAPTANSLGQIVIHLGLAERLWARVVYAGETMDLSWRQHMFDLPDHWTRQDVVDFYERETAAADAVFDTASSFDLRSQGEMRPTTLRWVIGHLVEETARHVGHMDITRELLDGSTGR
jgi:uncharacterized damage-inducible protein DinB